MTTEREIRVLKGALQTILLEAKEPIIKVYAKSALDETRVIPEKQLANAYCGQHNWYGLNDEKCPICKNPTPQ